MQNKDLDLNLHMEKYLQKLNEKHPININRCQMKHNSNIDVPKSFFIQIAHQTLSFSHVFVSNKLIWLPTQGTRSIYACKEVYAAVCYEENL